MDIPWNSEAPFTPFLLPIPSGMRRIRGVPKSRDGIFPDFPRVVFPKSLPNQGAALPWNPWNAGSWIFSMENRTGNSFVGNQLGVPGVSWW